jgi:hypothetical protein
VEKDRIKKILPRVTIITGVVSMLLLLFAASRQSTAELVHQKVGKVITTIFGPQKEPEKFFYSEFEKGKLYFDVKPYVIDNGQGLAFIYIGQFRKNDFGFRPDIYHRERIESFFAYWKKQYPEHSSKIKSFSPTAQNNLYLVLYGP